MLCKNLQATASAADLSDSMFGCLKAWMHRWTLDFIDLRRTTEIQMNSCLVAYFWSLWGCLGAYFGSLWDRLGSLWTPSWLLWRSLGPLGSHVTCFEAPWALLGRILERPGLILECSRRPKRIQSDPGWDPGDTLKTSENRCVFMGLRGWRLLDCLQNAILAAMGAT